MPKRNGPPNPRWFRPPAVRANALHIGRGFGIGLIVGSAEFLGPNEREGWSVAGKAVPLLYIGWSLRLVAMGIELLA